MATKTLAKSKTTTIGHYLLDTLHSHGVDHIFGVPGDYILQFDKMIEEHSVQFINATRENTAGHMADAYARLKGLGVACTTYGVGINITNAVSQAFVENSPLVIISGTAGSEEFASRHYLHHMFQGPSQQVRDTTQMDIFKKITVAQSFLDNPLTAQKQIDWVLEQCLSLKKPVYIEIPRNQINASVTLAEKEEKPHELCDPEALEEVLSEAAQLLKNCNRPVIWVGHEIQRCRLGNAVLEFAEKYRIPIVSSLLGKTTISEFHPLYMGIYQGKMSFEEIKNYVENADAVFVLGVLLNEIETGVFSSELKHKQTISATSEGIKVNHHHYNHISMKHFINGLARLDLNIRFRNDYPAYIDRRIPVFKPQKRKKITVQRVFDCLQQHLKTEHIVVSDFGDALFGCADLILEQDNFLSNPYFASLGFGVPAAVGAAIAFPQKRAVCVVGDGAFQMTCTELSTAIRYGVDPIIILLNNHGYSTERPLLDGAFNDIHGWKYSKIPLVLDGGIGSYVTTEEELEKTLSEAFGKRGAFHLIEIELDKTDLSPALQRFANAVRK
jgi:TPP-dependent 2-oxoacid decarboxylase